MSFFTVECRLASSIIVFLLLPPLPLLSPLPISLLLPLSHTCHLPPLQLAWAPGRGVKGAGLKAFWDQEVGSSYIPWSFVKAQSDVNTMSDGGWIDNGTLPPGFTTPPAGLSLSLSLSLSSTYTHQPYASFLSLIALLSLSFTYLSYMCCLILICVIQTVGGLHLELERVQNCTYIVWVVIFLV